MAKKLSIQQFISRARLLHGETYDYTRVCYTNAQEFVEIGCPSHGWFKQRASAHLMYGCNQCGNQRGSFKRRISREEFIARANEIHEYRYTYADVAIERQHDLVEIGCPVHGNFRQAANDHLKGHGCKRCGIAQGAAKRKRPGFTTAEFIERAIAVQGDRYDYQNTCYRGAFQPVSIICKLHGPFDQLPPGHLRGEGCRKCGVGKLSIKFEEFERRAREVHGDKYDYQHYTKMTDKVSVICPEHGLFRQTGTDHVVAQAGCPMCARQLSRIRLRYTRDEYEKKLAEKYEGRISLIGAYVDLEMLTTFDCIVHGAFERTPDSVLNQNKHGCSLCWGAIRGLSMRLTQDEFEQRAQSVHGAKYQYGTFTKTDRKITIQCPKHGAFTQNAGNHLAGMGCPSCGYHKTASQNAWLDMMGLAKEHREVWLKLGDKQIRADGYDPSSQTVYEFWGDFWHGNPSIYEPTTVHPVAKITFGELYELTLNKRKMIVESGYHLIEIWETDWKRIHESQRHFHAT